MRRPGPGQRFLETNEGAPFFLLGDTAWSLAVSASKSDVVRYLDDRQAKGFNAVTFETTEAMFAGGNGNRPPKNWYGDAPFFDLHDFTTPNEAFWANVEHVVAQAAARDILCIVFAAYEGYAGGYGGWYRQMAAQGPAKLRAYGAWLGRRFSAYDNIVWVAGGDNDAADKRLTRAVVDGIKSASDKWLFAWHGARNTNALAFWAGDLDWLDLNLIYDSTDHAAVNAEFSRNHTMVKPFARVEDTYENPLVGRVPTALIRWLAWDSALQGGTGAIYGDVAVWSFDGPRLVADPTSWDAALDRPAGNSMKHLKEMFQSKPWTRLAPDFTSHGWMTSGWSKTRFAALAADGSFGLAYAQDAREGMTFDMGKLSGPRVLVRWYDPASGAFVTEGSYPASGSREFSRTTANAQADADWVLLFESV